MSSAHPALTAKALADARARFETVASEDAKRWLELYRQLVECTTNHNGTPRVFVAKKMYAWRIARELSAPETIAKFDPARVVSLADVATASCEECGAPALLVGEEFPLHDWDNTWRTYLYALCTAGPHVATLSWADNGGGNSLTE